MLVRKYGKKKQPSWLIHFSPCSLPTIVDEQLKFEMFARGFGGAGTKRKWKVNRNCYAHFFAFLLRFIGHRQRWTFFFLLFSFSGDSVQIALRDFLPLIYCRVGCPPLLFFSMRDCVCVCVCVCVSCVFFRLLWWLAFFFSPLRKSASKKKKEEICFCVFLLLFTYTLFH